MKSFRSAAGGASGPQAGQRRPGCHEHVLRGRLMRRTKSESRSVVCMAGLLLIGMFLVVAVVAQGQQANGSQSGRANAAADLPYKLVEWPTAPTSAAGVPGAWNFIQVASVATTARG